MPLFYLFIGLGGFSILVENEKIKRILLLLFAIGLLFYGLEIMKDSMQVFSKNFNINEYKNYPLIVFLGLGFIITAIIQSSSAMKKLLNYLKKRSIWQLRQNL